MKDRFFVVFEEIRQLKSTVFFFQYSTLPIYDYLPLLSVQRQQIPWNVSR